MPDYDNIAKTVGLITEQLSEAGVGTTVERCRLLFVKQVLGNGAAF